MHTSHRILEFTGGESTNAHLLALAQQHFRVPMRRLLPDAHQLNRTDSRSVQAPQYGAGPQETWSKLVKTWLRKFNRRSALWDEHHMAVPLRNENILTDIWVTVENTTINYHSEKRRHLRAHAGAAVKKARADGKVARKAGAASHAQFEQDRIDECAPDLYYLSFSSDRAYNDWRGGHLQLRHPDSERRSKAIGPEGVRGTLPPTLEKVLNSHVQTMTQHGMSYPEKSLPSPEMGRYADPLEMLALGISKNFVQGKLAINLWPSRGEVCRRLSTRLFVLFYADGWPCANTDMSDDSFMVVDVDCVIWWKGQSDMVLQGIWVGSENAKFQHISTGSLQPFEEGKWYRLRFPAFDEVSEHGEPVESWVEVQFSRAETEAMDDNKMLNWLMQVAGGSARCRSHTTQPLPWQLFKNFKNIKLATKYERAQWWLRALVLIADRCVDALDNKASWLSMDDVKAQVKAAKKFTGPKMRRADMNVAMATPGKHSWASIATGIDDPFCGPHLRRITKSTFENVVRLRTGSLGFPSGAHEPVPMLLMLFCEPTFSVNITSLISLF
eukprot:COSAG01_NODE_180_length_22910_cov_19.255710_1_plen_555_part_00